MIINTTIIKLPATASATIIVPELSAYDTLVSYWLVSAKVVVRSTAAVKTEDLLIFLNY